MRIFQQYLKYTAFVLISRSLFVGKLGKADNEHLVAINGIVFLDSFCVWNIWQSRVFKYKSWDLDYSFALFLGANCRLYWSIINFLLISHLTIKIEMFIY